ncbi:MAG: 4'-phosphopantetheinyl transferase superfamily protein [Acidiferrobacterales bacterium]|nr:4'-phosphopantetheinyl transferase superfamily protein [Acidiferrobacterales bacterium]
MLAEGAVDNTKAVSELALEWHQNNANTIDFNSLQGSIHLWILDLSDTDLETLSQRATALEVGRASRITDKQKRLLYLGGRVGLRSLLSRYTGLHSHALNFGYGHRGKPRLENCPHDQEITFNYTLSGDKVLYAFSVDCQLGVDLEQVPRKVNAEAMARSKLALLERETWKKVPKEEKESAMLSCWTRKEAYGKVLGVGIRYFMREVVLFTELQCPWFQVSKTGLFNTTSHSSMPELLQGVQIGLPFSGVATLMYGRDHLYEPTPQLLATCLKI